MHVPILLLLTVVLIFICAVTLVMGLSTTTNDRTLMNQRMDTIMRTMTDDYNSIPSLADSEFDASFAQRVVRPTLRRLSTVLEKATPGGAMDEMRLQLIKAGNPARLGVAEFIGLKLVAFVLMFGVGLLAQAILASDVLMRIVVLLLCCVAGFVLPDSILQQMIAARQSVIRKKLPDTIDLLIVSVEAGLGFDGAVAKVVEKVTGPIAYEFGHTLDEMRLGKTRAKALRDMAARVDIAEMTTFVAAIYQSEQLGVSIASVLRVQSETIRVARTQAIREAAAKLPVKMLIPLIFFIFPAIFVVLIGPGLIGIMNAFKGL